jgi:bis(5'-nucleosyl)-tetraphosphatase (symmetrical)
MKRRIFVGDIQGCRVELEELLEKLAFDPSSDDLEPVGDFVNRGPDSAGVLRLCRSLGEGVVGGVLGNHDVHLLRVARGIRRTQRRDTIDDVLGAKDRDELLAWLAARPFVRVWNDIVLVHAGIHPAWASVEETLSHLDPLADGASLAFAISARYCSPSGECPPSDWPPPKEPYRPWYEFYPRDPNDRRTVVFGHWARNGLVIRPQVRGLDTGCVWGGKLSAWIAEEDRIVEVDAKRAYAEHD